MEEDNQGAERVQFFKDDFVQSVSKSRKVGIVLSVGRKNEPGSDSDSDSEAEPLSDGKVLVGWNTGMDNSVDVSKLKLLDRRFAHGEIVVKTSDPLGQSGFIHKLELHVDMKYPNGEVVRNVNSRDLRRIRQFMKDDYVVQGHYIGRVDEVVEDVTLEFDNKAVCKVARADPDILSPLETDEFSIDEPECWFYPGLRVRAARPSVLRHAKWIKGRSRWEPTCLEATVVRVEAAFVVVDWGAGVEVADQQLPQDLLHLPHFSHMNWRVNDHSLPVKASGQENGAPSDVVERDSTSSSEGEEDPKGAGAVVRSRRKLGRSLPKRSRRKRRKEQTFECAGVIIRTRTTADVIWQDGTKSQDVPTTSLRRSELYGWNDFWPESYVTETPPEAEDDDSVYRRVGIVKVVDPKQRTARVKWFKRVSSPLELREVESEETVSIFEIVEHPDYHYNLGDIVMRLSQVGEEEERQDGELSWIGTIIGSEDGDIEVEWGNGMVSRVGPHAIYVAHRVDDDDSADGGDDSSSWETMDSDDEQKGKLEGGDAETVEPDNQGGVLSYILNVTRTIVNSVMGFGSSVGKGTVDSHSAEVRNPPTVSEAERNVGEDSDDESEETEETEETVERPLLNGVEDKVLTAEGASEEDTDAEEKISAAEEDTVEEKTSTVGPELVHETFDAAEALANGGVASSKQFDVIKEAPADHLLLNRPEQTSYDRKWVKKVNREWTVLQENLPESIHVRIFESRMDLMRAAIVGAAGTPYHDGFFVFDIFLPPDYPASPPVVLYRSGGLMLNPNLYADGKICLSLLNTWRGRGSELWNPATSNLLQVLLSIQGLVLNAKPYFNEADYDRYTGVGEAERNSVEYNESTFILSCKSMLYLLRRPPLYFEELIRSHFRSRALKILSTCKAYGNGVPVGSPIDKPLDPNSEAPAGFKLLLDKLIPRLAEAFKEVGATGCEEFVSEDNFSQE